MGLATDTLGAGCQAALFALLLLGAQIALLAMYVFTFTRIGMGIPIMGFLLRFSTDTIKHGILTSVFFGFFLLFVLDAQLWGKRHRVLGHLANVCAAVGVGLIGFTVLLYAMIYPYLPMAMFFGFCPLYFVFLYHVQEQLRSLCSRAAVESKMSMVGRQVICVEEAFLRKEKELDSQKLGKVNPGVKGKILAIQALNASMKPCSPDGESSALVAPGSPGEKQRVRLQIEIQDVHPREVGWTSLYATMKHSTTKKRMLWKVQGVELSIGKFLYVLGTTAAITGAVALYLFYFHLQPEVFSPLQLKLDVFSAELDYNATTQIYSRQVLLNGTYEYEIVYMNDTFMENAYAELVQNVDCKNTTAWMDKHQDKQGLIELECAYFLAQLLYYGPYIASFYLFSLGSLLFFLVPSDGDTHNHQQFAHLLMNVLIVGIVGIWIAYQLTEEGSAANIIMVFCLVFCMVIIAVLWRFVLSSYEDDVQEQLEEFFNELGKEDQGDFASMLQSPKSGSPGGEKKKTAQEKLKDFTDGLYVRSIGLLIGFPMFIPLAVLSYLKQKLVRERVTRTCLFDAKQLKKKAKDARAFNLGFQQSTKIRVLKPDKKWKGAEHKSLLQEVQGGGAIVTHTAATHPNPPAAAGANTEKVKLSEYVPPAWEWTFCKNVYLGLFDTRLLTRTIWVGMWIFLFFGGGFSKPTSLALSMLNSALASVDLMTTTGIFVFVGVVMFLMPPIPGVPVYLCGGVVLVRAAERQWSVAAHTSNSSLPMDLNASAVPVLGLDALFQDSTWSLAVAYTSLVCMVLKLSAVTLQQKVIGELMGSRSVAVRQLAIVNSATIRTVNCILRKPGLSKYKVFVLIGGPDWPTSVVAGILKTPLLWNLLGTLPVFPVIFFTVVVGAMETKKAEDPSLASVSTVILTLATITSTYMTLMMAFSSKKYSELHVQEVKDVPEDESVAAADAEELLVSTELADMRDWSKLNTGTKTLLLMATAMMEVSVIMFLMSGVAMFPDCLESVSVITNVSAPPFNGKLSNLVIWPYGHLACGLHVGALFLLYVFKKTTVCGKTDKAESTERYSQIPRSASISDEELDEQNVML